jgi:hypothetical protein
MPGAEEAERASEVLHRLLAEDVSDVIRIRPARAAVPLH